MRYALISDIHANLPALQAVLADIDHCGDSDAIFHLGDLVGYAPWPNEVVETLREHGITGVAGNYDSTVATAYEHCGCRYEDEAQETLAHLSYEWTCAHVSAETRSRLEQLPFRMDLRPGGGHRSAGSLILVHGTPTLNTLYWTEDRSERFCSRMIAAAQARAGDVIAFGHTHLPWSRAVEGVLLVNAGSVGRPKDGDPRAGYVVVDMAESEAAVQVRRVPYDIALAARAIDASMLPDEFAVYLETGGRALHRVRRLPSDEEPEQ